MRFTPTILLLVGLMGCDARNNPKAPQDAAVTAIRNLGGSVAIDKKSPDKPVTAVSLRRTPVTDAGLVHLNGLTRMHRLILSRTRVTDAGLVHLKGLTSLKELQLHDTEVTDAGLLHLKGLTSLEELNLIRTKVTDAGVKELQAALPKCRISR